ncbi:nucleotidyltransferase family protein [Candidatus Atribacteria bacterium MT.SAG.1]|nr:nucleotidyltransferase family protein [Candidatus Atribacteria bacterium MT.SAG.1]
MIWGIILAAGEGKRMGKVKLTLPLGNKQLIEWVLQAVKLAPLDKYILVVRPEDREIIKIGKRWGAEIVLNPEYKSGMSTSIQKALSQIPSEGLEGFFILLGDQPLINPSVIYKMLRAFTPGKKEIVVPFYKDKQGNPVLFDNYWKKELMALIGDIGGRVLIKAHPEKVKRVKLSNESVLLDIDREEDYEKIKNIFNSLYKKGRI